MQVEQQERFVRVPPVLNPVHGQVGDDICGIPFDPYIPLIRYKVRVVIIPLSGQDLELIDPFRIVSKMQFPEHGCLVARLLEQLGESHLGSIEREPVIDLPVQVAVLACENGGAGRGTDGVGDTGIIE